MLENKTISKKLFLVLFTFILGMFGLFLLISNNKPADEGSNDNGVDILSSQEKKSYIPTSFSFVDGADIDSSIYSKIDKGMYEVNLDNYCEKYKTDTFCKYSDTKGAKSEVLFISDNEGTQFSVNFQYLPVDEGKKLLSSYETNLNLLQASPNNKTSCIPKTALLKNTDSTVFVSITTKGISISENIPQKVIQIKDSIIEKTNMEQVFGCESMDDLEVYEDRLEY
jgi:hypothetical protein